VEAVTRSRWSDEKQVAPNIRMAPIGGSIKMYLWEIPKDYPEELIGRYDKSRSPDRFLLKQGKPVDIREIFVKYDVKAEKLQGYDYLANSAMVPLVNSRVANVLMSLATEEIQLIRAHVIALDMEIPDYQIVVATKQVKAVDHKTSEYVYVPGTKSIMSFKKLRCLEDCLGTLHIARDTEYLSNLYISEVLRNALAGC